MSLKDMRIKQGFSQSQLSKASNISLRTIQQYEQKERNINGANFKTILTFAKTLNCKVIEILDDEELIELIKEIEFISNDSKSINLKEVRKRNNMTQLELSQITNIKLKTIKNYEQKERNINGANPKSILKIAKALNCKVIEILDDEELIELIKTTDIR